MIFKLLCGFVLVGKGKNDTERGDMEREVDG